MHDIGGLLGKSHLRVAQPSLSARQCVLPHPMGLAPKPWLIQRVNKGVSLTLASLTQAYHIPMLGALGTILLYEKEI
jgi:hypothetical protein